MILLKPTIQKMSDVKDILGDMGGNAAPVKLTTGNKVSVVEYVLYAL